MSGDVSCSSSEMFSFKMLFLFPLFFSVLVVLSQSSTEDSNRKENTTLLLVHALFRHGERAPLVIYKNDLNSRVEWPVGIGKLTKLGKHHHYALGKYLRSMYKDFLTINPKEVLVNSSAEDRCLRGAEVTVASLYEPEGIWKFEDDLNWQPIPVSYLPTHLDKYLSADSDCPRGFDELMRLRNSEEFQQLTRKHQEMLEEISKYTEMDMSKEFNVLYFGDTLRVEKLYNLTFPTAIEKYFDEILEFGDRIFNCFYGSDLILRLRTGPLLQEISENMMKKKNGDIPDLKIQLYCTQDVTVASVLTALNFTNMPRPPNCATLLFELHEMADATMAVRLRYLNSSDPLTNEEELHTLILDDCSEFCPLESFTKKFQHLIPVDWEQECQPDSSDIKKSVKILIIIFTVVVTLALILLVFVYIYSKRSIEDLEEKSLTRVVVNNESG